MTFVSHYRSAHSSLHTWALFMCELCLTAWSETMVSNIICFMCKVKDGGILESQGSNYNVWSDYIILMFELHIWYWHWLSLLSFFLLTFWRLLNAWETDAGAVLCPLNSLTVTLTVLSSTAIKPVKLALLTASASFCCVVTKLCDTPANSASKLNFFRRSVKQEAIHVNEHNVHFEGRSSTSLFSV